MQKTCILPVFEHIAKFRNTIIPNKYTARSGQVYIYFIFMGINQLLLFIFYFYAVILQCTLKMDCNIKLNYGCINLLKNVNIESFYYYYTSCILHRFLC